MKKQGFTLFELLVVMIFLATAGIVLAIQTHNTRSSYVNSHRKTAINAIYFSLEENFYKNHSYYPETLKAEDLKTVDPELFTDTNGTKLGEEGYLYQYETSDCQDGKCKNYKLSVPIQGEQDFTKTNRGHEQKEQQK